MKKVLAMILALASVLSLCACGKDDYYVEEEDNNDQSQVIQEDIQQPTEPPQAAEPAIQPPTAAEEEQILAYMEAVSQISGYRTGELSQMNCYIGADYHYYTETYPDNSVLEYFFQVILDSDVVDKFAGTEYAANYDLEYWDRNEVLGWFGQISNVMLCTKRTDMDALGNTNNTYLYKVWGYDPMGVKISPEAEARHLVEIGLPVIDEDIMDAHDVRRDVYDENGNLTAIEYYDLYDTEKTTNIRLIPTFDDAGRIASLDGMRSSGQSFKVYYTYDEKGNLTCLKAEGIYGNPTTTYTYDDAGRIIGINENGEWIRTYTYDDNGNLSGSTHKRYYGSFLDQDIAVSYEYDNLGRVIRTYCRDVEAGGQTQAIYDLVYGDYYYLQPAA